MVGRMVRLPYYGVVGYVRQWTPLTPALTDILVETPDGRRCWYSSHMAEPVDMDGPLPSRTEAIEKAKREHAASIDAIRDRWNKTR